MVDKYNLNQIKKFFKASKGQRFEVYYKMIFAYRLSRYELMNIKWEDIDFENNTILICPVKYINDAAFHYKTLATIKDERFQRLYPLLPHIKTLLLKEKQKQIQNSKTFQFDFSEQNFICIKKNGERLNARTLSRNMKYVAREAKIPQIILPDFRNSLDDYLLIKAQNAEFYRCWKRYDISVHKTNEYKDVDLFSNKSFLKLVDNITNQTEMDEEM